MRRRRRAVLVRVGGYHVGVWYRFVSAQTGHLFPLGQKRRYRLVLGKWQNVLSFLSRRDPRRRKERRRGEKTNMKN